MTASVSIPILSISKQVIPPMHEKRISAAVTTDDDGRIIVIGGLDRDESMSKPTTRLSSCEVYDGGTNEWTRLAKDLPEGRSGCGVAAIGRHVYVAGGKGMKFQTMSTMVAYSLDENKWVPKQAMRDDRERFASAVSGGRFFVFGGLGDDASVRNSCQVYDPETNTWSDLPPMFEKRVSCAAVSVDDKIYVMGGWDHRFRPLSTVEVFDLQTERWVKGPDMPSPRYAHAAVAIEKFIFVTGGHDKKHRELSSTQIYSVDQEKWLDGPSMATTRSFHISRAINENRVMVAGGFDASGNSNTAEVFKTKLGTRASHVNISTDQVIKNEKIEDDSVFAKIQCMEKEMYDCIVS